jgi:tetratricopeptide (TPR) repeat protein
VTDSRLASPVTEASIADLVDATSRILAELGPMTEEQLAAALADRGADLDDDDVLDAMDEVLDASDGLLGVLEDGRWVSLPALLTGRVFTHRVTGPELKHDLLSVKPDLGPVLDLAGSEAYHRLIDGTPMDHVCTHHDTGTLTERGIPLDVIGDHGALLLPPGYLRDRGCREGDVIALGVEQEGLRFEVITAPLEPVTVLAQRLEAVLTRSSHPPVETDVAVWAACEDDPALFTKPLPPLAEALAACGLPCDDDWLGPPGFDFGRWRVELRCAVIARRNDLDSDEALAVLTMGVLYRRMLNNVVATEGDEGNGGDLARRATVQFLAEPAVAEAVLAETIGYGRDNAETLVRFVDTIEPLAPRAARPGVLWLRGKAHEHCGDIAAAEADYEAARAIDPEWAPALVALAGYASDRGDADRAISLLHRAGVAPDDPLLNLLGLFQTGPRPGIGRNDPCWCGSGHKYKKCHLKNEHSPLEERGLWLFCKAIMFVLNGRWRTKLEEVARLRAEYADEPDAYLDFIQDPLVSDVVLFEGGALANFVATRGDLLPDDERLLAEQWLLVDRSVYDVEDVQLGRGLTVRDVRTGDTHQVRERAATRTLRVGELVCARVSPAGETMQIFGSVERVALHERDELIALLDSRPDAMRLISFLSRRLAPAAFSNTEGDPIVLCEATLHATNPAGLAAALDRTYERDTESLRWVERVNTDEMAWIRATLSLDGHELTVHTNSEPRIDRVLDQLRTFELELEVVTQSRRPASDQRQVAALAAAYPAEARDTAPSPDDNPEMAAMLDQFIRDYEQRWLDEPIPALAGHTPRQAAADPTRRGDLIRLLDSFPAASSPGVMSPDRLRAELGL